MIDVKEQMKHEPTRIWHDTIRKYAEKSNYKTALDVGTAAGLSAYTIATSGKGTVISIGDKGQQGAMQLMRDYDLSDRVEFFEGKSHDWWTANKDVRFDFICIDGSHKYPEVLEDAREAWDRLNDGGYIVFDDYDHPRLKEDVGRAVNQFAQEMMKMGVNVGLKIENAKAIVHKLNKNHE